jgi:hypothetical protein
MKALFSFILLLFCLASSGQVTTTISWWTPPLTEVGDTIYYSPSQKLVWDDFKGKPESRNIAAAITSSGLGFSLEMRSRGGKTDLRIKVYCFFDRSKSWVKPGMNSDYALVHEQHHFDISFIVANQFSNKLKTMDFTLGNYNKLVDEIYEASNRELERLQNQYDGETKNGQLKNVQEEWNRKIETRLAALPKD